MSDYVKSTHVCEVVPITMEKHPNADSLSIIPVFGYCVVGRTQDWEGIGKGIFIPPDSLVDTSRPEFSFLIKNAKANGWAKIKAIRLRGVVSYGLLIPAPAEAVLGEDWAERLGVKHYEPEIEREAGLGGRSQNVKDPVHFSKYDIDSAMRYHKLFVEGERVFCVEKVEGQNWRSTVVDGELYVGSRNYWKADIESCLFWKTLRSDPAIEKFLRDHPEYILFGESYGNVGGFCYGLPAGEVRLACFDIFDKSAGRWLHFEEGRDIGRDLPWCPIVADIPWNFERAKELANFKTILGDGAHISEGLVISPEKERYDYKVGRVKFKIKNPEYELLK